MKLIYEIQRYEQWERVPPRSKIRPMLDGAISVKFPKEKDFAFFPRAFWRIVRKSL